MIFVSFRGRKNKRDQPFRVGLSLSQTGPCGVTSLAVSGHTNCLYALPQVTAKTLRITTGQRRVNARVRIIDRLRATPPLRTLLQGEETYARDHGGGRQYERRGAGERGPSRDGLWIASCGMVREVYAGSACEQTLPEHGRV